MTLRVGRFKPKTLPGFCYIRSLTYATLTDCHKSLLACSSIRRFSSVDQERPGIHPALLSGDPSLWGWRERYTQASTSSYRDLISQFSKALRAKENDIERVTNSFNTDNHTRYSTPVDTLKCANVSSRTKVKQDTCDTGSVNSSGRSVSNLNYAISDKDFLQYASQSELKSEADLNENNGGGTGGGKEKPEKTKPDQLDLEIVKDYYIERIPYFFKVNEDIQRGLHHKDIIFENNYFEKQTISKGLTGYLKEQTRLRIVAAVKFPSYFFQTVGATTNLDEGCVKLHWRFYYIRNIEYFTTYLWKRFQSVPIIDCYNFQDGISTFHVNKDGQITKHQVDRLMPIQKVEVDTMRPRFKLASLIGLAAPTPKTNYDSTAKFKNKPEPQG